MFLFRHFPVVLVLVVFCIFACLVCSSFLCGCFCYGFVSVSCFAFVFIVLFLVLFSRTKNQPKEEVLGTDIPRTSGGHSRGYPGPKLRSGNSKSWKNKHLGADIHDPKARTSTTLRDFQKLRSEELWAEFSFPIFVLTITTIIINNISIIIMIDNIVSLLPSLF